MCIYVKCIVIVMGFCFVYLVVWNEFGDCFVVNDDVFEWDDLL